MVLDTLGTRMHSHAMLIVHLSPTATPVAHLNLTNLVLAIRASSIVKISYDATSTASTFRISISHIRSLTMIRVCVSPTSYGMPPKEGVFWIVHPLATR